jgi:hypothetical protein
MKTKIFAPIFFIAFILVACKKDEKTLTRPVEFTETTYQTLGTFDQSGKPNYLLPRDVISSEMLSFINTTLPQNQDLRITNPDLLKNTVPDIAISQQSDVFMTFVFSETVTTEAVAFYTYPSNQPPATAKDIKTITYVFPNTGNGTTLQPGDKVKIGRFNPGTSIGFVILQNAWSLTYHDLDNKAVHYCSNDVLNPEVDIALKKHAVLINYTPENKVLIAFENQDRTTPECNHDFNDVVIYATVTP